MRPLVPLAGEAPPVPLLESLMINADPYRAQAGPELDAVIHVRLLGNPPPPATACPAYSCEDEIAMAVLARLRKGRHTIVFGQTSMKDKPWFARYETNAMDGTEVFAETFALAVCRLALLRLADMER